MNPSEIKRQLKRGALARVAGATRKSLSHVSRVARGERRDEVVERHLTRRGWKNPREVAA